MVEFVNFIFSGINAVATAMLLFVLLYWLFVIIGFVGTDFLDFDVDVEPEFDSEVELGSAQSADLSWLNHVLVFFNLGKIPFMIWLSFLVAPLWFITINVTGFFLISSFWMGILIFLPALILSLFIAKFLTWPFVKFFTKIDQDTKEKEIIGKVGVVIVAATDNSKGQAEINYNGAFLRFTIRTKTGVSVAKGEQVLFIQKNTNEESFLIEPYQTI